MQRTTQDVQGILGDAVRFHQAGHLDEAITRYRQALVLDPEYAGVHNNLGTALFEQGKLEEAEASYRMALVFGPDDAEAHNNLGTVLYQSGKLDEAVASYRKTLALRPDHAEAHANLGTAFFALGKPDEALTAYRKALAVKPDFVAAHVYLGTVLWEQGKLAEAASTYRRALQLDPRNTEALDRLAAVLMMAGDAAAALDTVWRSLQIAETPKNRKLFADVIKKAGHQSSDGKTRSALSRALTEPWAKPGELAQITADFLKRDPEIGPCVRRAVQAWPKGLSLRELFGTTDLGGLSADPLLCGYLTSTQNTDIAMERFLTMARALMLEVATGAAPQTHDTRNESALLFYSALARQCFINEYVFFHGEEEIQAADKLRNSLVHALETGSPVPPLLVIATAAYFPLHAVPFSGRLLDRPWAAPVASILAQQIAEPLEEEQLRATIPRAAVIKDAVSRRVRDHYEDNPYPRWVRMPPGDGAHTITEYLSKKFPFASFPRQTSGKATELLSAGCGTGQIAIEVAMGIKADMLAIDLSLTSLGYAMRKTGELGLTSIAYAQGDILELGASGRHFDVIECSGVLHHMADPFAGWRVLLSLLRPGGFMLVGLYSEVARRDIERARQRIAGWGLGASADEIRRCRQRLLEGSESLGAAVTSSDFFGTSSCRDLLFHSQEMQMRLGDIASFLRDNRLSFLGFEMADDILQSYRNRFADDPAATTLDHWQLFERDNPHTFAGMYNFWVQKSA